MPPRLQGERRVVGNQVIGLPVLKASIKSRGDHGKENPGRRITGRGSWKRNLKYGYENGKGEKGEI